MTTKLEILNHVLSVVGETPVSSVDSQHPTVLSATVEIDRVTKELQKRGWWFNTEFALSLGANDEGEVIVPSTALFLWPLDPRSHLVQRGTRLYDPVNHTFTINADVQVDLISLLPIEELPEAAAMYIQHKTALDFYVNDDGDDGQGSKTVRLDQRVTEAWAELQKAQLKATKVNAKYRTSVALLRSRMSQAGSTGYNPNWPGGRQ